MSTNDNQKSGPLTLASALGLGSEQPLGLRAMIANLGRVEAKGLYYNNKSITLDGYKFVDCRFDNCLLHINSDNFELVNCIIDPRCRINYSANVSKPLKLFLSRYSWAPDHFPNFAPKVSADGAVTISEFGT